VERCHPKLMTSYMTPEELKQEEDMIAFDERTTRWANPNDLISTPLTRMQRFYPHDARNARHSPPTTSSTSSKDKKHKKKTPPPPPQSSFSASSSSSSSNAPSIPPKLGHPQEQQQQHLGWRRGSAAAAATATKNAVYSPLRDRIGTIKLTAERRGGGKEKKKCCEML